MRYDKSPARLAPHSSFRQQDGLVLLNSSPLMKVGALARGWTDGRPEGWTGGWTHDGRGMDSARPARSIFPRQEA
jgi:hypothetical protein